MIGKVLLDLIMKKKLETTFSRFEFFGLVLKLRWVYYLFI
ncbi:hypothetical protein RV05_GL000065 [Enterococcus hirae]|uniref:Uncharacterized protein n=1 Tax=Enterococcus hirae (strain ATCC 9790 / DSM 20160 / JCM 8729 / LMG 6399 / NBRC 3181 / NCIMB 6459 / NCDO 1258 / NCTC 12367 / WDCM 00089 / R) TaxID=768486 RepID=I6T896_ENTHA|nr:hypothetical protein EHR_02185 [Enterococcus hirae ATCC 9790]OJG53674.1 hypothetical protein RV05_GL000065 [Enterococcus hirae]